MPYNGSGSFTLVTGNPVVTGTVINSTVHNNTQNDIAAGLTNVITRDGQSVPFGNLPMAGFKHTGAADATVAGQYIVQGQSGASLGSLTVNGISTEGNATTLRSDLANTSDIAKGDALVGVKRTATAAVATNLHNWIEGQVFNYKADFGGICNGVTDETANLQSVLTNLPVGSALYLTGDINFTSVTLSKFRVKLIGDARMRGVVNVTSDGSVGQSSFFLIDGLTFWPTAENQTIDGIAVTNLSFGAVRNCNFRGVRNCVYVPPRATQPYFQDVAKIEVSGCQYDYAKYFIKNEYTGLAANYATGDWTITNNSGLALVDHIKGDKWDGAIIANNTFFFLLPDPSAAKRRGVDLTNSPYVTITGNKIFEAGADGILLADCHFHVVEGNTIAYAGSIISGRGIDVTYTTVPALNSGTVCGNTIIRPSTGGIRINANSRQIGIQDNNIIQPGANDHAIVGPTQLTEGVIVTSGTIGCYVDGNIVRNGTYNLNQGTGNIFGADVFETTTGNKLIRHTVTRSLLASAANPQVTDVDEYERIEYSNTVQIDGISATASTGVNYKRVYCRFTAPGCVLTHSTTFILKGAVNANPPAQGWMEFEIDVVAGITREMFRSF